MRKVRVEKLLPFTEIGKEIKLNETNGIVLGKIILLTQDTIVALIKEGFLSWVKEEKTLEEKFLDYGISGHPQLAKIATDHFKGMVRGEDVMKCFDEKYKEWYAGGFKTHGWDNFVRAALSKLCEVKK